MRAWRHHFVLGLFLLAVGALSTRVVFLGVTERDFLQQEGDARSIRRESIPALRGVIYDRNGEALAVSTPVYAVSTNPQKADFSTAQFAAMSGALEIPQMDLERRLQTHADKQFVYLKRHAGWDMSQRLDALDLPHLELRPEYRRYYPAAEIAAHVTGLTDIDDQASKEWSWPLNATCGVSPVPRLCLRTDEVIRYEIWIIWRHHDLVRT